MTSAYVDCPSCEYSYDPTTARGCPKCSPGDEPGAVVLDDVAEFLSEFVAFANVEQLHAVTLWCLHTHCLDGSDLSPRLALLSPQKQCGKSRLLELLELLCRKARVTVSMSAAYLFRTVELEAPTLLIDEIDAVFGSKQKNDSHEDLRSLINSGFRRGATVGRIVGDGAKMKPKDFAVFCAVGMAGIGDNCLPDTVLDRAVVVRMRRRAPGEFVAPLRRRRVEPRALALQGRLAAWALRHVDELSEADPEMPPGIIDRPADTWEPLLAVADQAGGEWPGHARRACVALNAVRADADPSIGVRLLADVRELYAATGRDRLFTATIVDHLNGIDEAPWSGWHKEAGLKARDLARLLRDFGVRSKNVRAGTEQAKGYELVDLADAFIRYLAPHPPATDVPTSQPSASPENVASDQEERRRDVGTEKHLWQSDGVGPSHNGDHAPTDLMNEVF